MVDIFPVKHIKEGNELEEKTFILTPVNITIVEDNGKKKTVVDYKQITNIMLIIEKSVAMKIDNKDYFIFIDEDTKFIELIKQYQQQ